MYSMQKIASYIFVLIVITLQANAQRPESHAPIGVMGDHTHARGEFMLSYRYMHMWMEGNRNGTDRLTSDEIVTTVPNRFFGNPMQPPTLRVVPTYMSMDMHMLGAMYAPTEWLTLMAMANFANNTMHHLTYRGGKGTNRLGSFITQTKGMGDTRIAGLIRLFKSAGHQVHINAGLSIPTGSFTREDDVLTPLEAKPTIRVPYPMQLGSGTYDVLPGVTYIGHAQRIAWGGQLMGTVRLGENEASYALGNKIVATTWASYRIKNWLSSSVRVAFRQVGKVNGRDAQIMAPVQTANPDFIGGQRADVALGVNLLGITGFTKDFRLAAEFTLPVYQNLNGPQLETDYILTLGVQYAF